jgi:hypothetical protein
MAIRIANHMGINTNGIGDRQQNGNDDIGYLNELNNHLLEVGGFKFAD